MLINIYALNEDAPEFFEELFKEIEKVECREMIIVGDYNLVQDPAIDRIEPVLYSPKSCQLLEVVKKSWDLIDPWRDRNPEERIYSWMQVKNNKIQVSHIDFALTTIGIANCIS